MNCWFCHRHISEIYLTCTHHGEVLVRYNSNYTNPNVSLYVIFYVQWNNNTYSILLEKGKITIYQIYDTPEDYYETESKLLMEMEHELFPPEQAPQKLQQFLKLLIFS
jgi:hypothetical protein